jgi:hypothetical protein
MEKRAHTQDLGRGAGVGSLAHKESTTLTCTTGIACAALQSPRPHHDSITEGSRGRWGAIGGAGQVAG